MPLGGMFKSASGDALACKMVEVCNFFRKRVEDTKSEDTVIEETAITLKQLAK